MPISLDTIVSDPMKLLDAVEDQWFERKGAGVAPRDVAKALVAFANAEGGMLAVGVSKERGLGGFTANPRLLNEVRQAAIDFTEPSLMPRIELVPCVNRQGGPDSILLLEVEPSEQMHRLKDGAVFLRVGDETRSLNHEQAMHLAHDKGVSQYDKEIIPHSTVDDFDPEAIDRYRTALGSRLAPLDLLRARGLYEDRGPRSGATWAGVLLFSKMPEYFHPNAYVRVLQYHGTEPRFGTRMNIVHDDRIEGTIPDVINGARERVGRLVKTFTRLRDDGRFGPVLEYPEAAWVEAIINAVTHRSYSLYGDHIRVKLFDNRMEIESPGRLPWLVRPDNIRSTRFSRNPRIARVLVELGLVRELGEGVDRMFSDMADHGLPAPEFRQGEGSVTVTLFNSRVEPEASLALHDVPALVLPLMNLLKEHGHLTVSEASEGLGVSRQTVRRYFAQLAQLGLAKRIATGPQDATAYWLLQTPSVEDGG